MLSAGCVGTKYGQANGVFSWEGDAIVLAQKIASPVVGNSNGRVVIIFLAERNEAMDRVAMLNEILEQDPKDAFARYGLAMEYSKQGNVERAMGEFKNLLATHPDYTAGYFMAAQTLASAGRTNEAKTMLTDGIASARRTGNSHAQSEMEAMLAELG
jgi:predicted Zn-dependent protease